MKEILGAIDTFTAVTDSYIKTNKMGQDHFLTHFLKLLTLLKKSAESGILVTALSFAMKQANPEKSSSDDFIAQYQECVTQLISKLSTACDSISPETTLGNDEVLQSLRKINKGFSDVLDRIQLETAITFQPVKGYAIQFVNQAKAYFQFIAVLRAHNVRESAFIRFARDVQDTKSKFLKLRADNNPDLEERAVSLKSLIVKGNEALKNPTTFHYFNFVNGSLATIGLNRIQNISDHLLALTTYLSIGKTVEQAAQLMIEFSEQCIMPFQVKQPSPKFSSALLDAMEDWDTKMLGTLAALSRNVEEGIRAYCMPGFFQRKVPENEKIRDNMQILRINISNISETYKMFDNIPTTFNKDDQVYSYVRHRFLLEEVNILRDLIQHTFQCVLDNKHPIEAMFRGTFVGNTVTGSPDTIQTAVRDRINLKFQGPTSEEPVKSTVQPQVASPKP